ncbi:hypothetical protein M885DRAFT_432683 [Pelagophyceae sp. CCMP2097]|nr:hypothetical protein M885DRAFT_432683 [Pelagophyceae sp. CCMP2097]
MASGDGLAMLMVSNGMDASKLAAVVESLKNASKAVGTHKRRALLWDAYGKIGNKLSGLSGPVDAFLKYTSTGDEGTAEICDFTKKQKHLIGNGLVEILGKKQKPLEEPDSKSWAIVFEAEAAAEAWEDFMHAEPVIYLTTSAAFVGTKLKRRQAKGLSACKTAKDVSAILADLEASLLSVDLFGAKAPALLAYNVLLAGPWSNPILAGLADLNLGHCSSTSQADVYESFTNRRSGHFLAQAERLLDQMTADVGRGEKLPLVCASSMKDAATARQNALMKRVFVHESKTQFIKNLKADSGDVECSVVTGDITGSKFDDFGAIVFEMFYRVDLSNFG